MSDPILEALRGYGIFAIMAYLILLQVGPWFRDKFWPSYARAREQKNEAEIAERKQRAEAEAVERERLKRLEERQVSAIESMASVTKELQLAQVRTDERLLQLLGGFAQHDQETRQAITDMKQRTAALDPLNPPSRPRPRRASE